MLAETVWHSVVLCWRDFNQRKPLFFTKKKILFNIKNSTCQSSRA